MKTSVTIFISIVAILTAFYIVGNKETFDAAGMVFNTPPEFYRKKFYDRNDWIVSYNPDQLAQPECMHYRGDPQELNWLSSTYRFWRM